MHTYELFLTDQCTRNCAFCDIPKGNYRASKDDIQSFINFVEESQDWNSRFKISFFGGEPLLCLNEIYEVCEEFKQYPNCILALVTNGDLLNQVDINKLPRNFKLSISAYDIFNDTEKYKRWIDVFKKFDPHLQFTFDEDTIDRLDEFIEICKSLDARFKIALSHSSKSWINISTDKLEKIVEEFYRNQFEDFYSNDNIDILPSTLDQHLSSFAEIMFFKDAMKEHYCVTDGKTSFFKGKNIGPCIRCNKNEVECPKRCLSCQFKLCCHKSCVAEYVNGDIDEKLCILNKAAFQAIYRFIKEHIDEMKMKQILSFILNRSLSR